MLIILIGDKALFVDLKDWLMNMISEDSLIEIDWIFWLLMAYDHGHWLIVRIDWWSWWLIMIIMIADGHDWWSC